jgi:hypothetical protein
MKNLVCSAEQWKFGLWCRTMEIWFVVQNNGNLVCSAEQWKFGL